MKSVFDWTKEITSKKRDISSFTDADWSKWDSFMVHRILSMNPDLIEVTNLAQNFPPENKKQIYAFYREYVPKNGRWYKYIKPMKERYSKELVEHIVDFYECSKREAFEMLLFSTPTPIESILKSRGVDEKEMNKIWPKKSR